MPIRVLDAATVGRIAAGEVVERPSSIAKELVENSLDAGATSVTVEIREGGVDYLRVTDNGCGIAPEEARLAFENHATSKIGSGDSLTDILTLGFRGEALPSIAAVSRVTMTTRTKNREAGVRLRVEGGQIMDVGEAGCPEGTTIVVKDLFFNTPVRRGFLKKPSTEAGVLGDMIARLILGNPGTAIRFINNGRTVYHSFGDGDMRHAALAVYGRETAEKMLFVDETEGSLRISGLIGVDDLARASRSQEFFFINGRTVRAPLMAQALETAVRTRVMIGQYPMCALSLRLPAALVDVNVHPSKLEVRFRDETDVRQKAEMMLVRACCGTKILDPEAVLREPVHVEERPVIRAVSAEQTTVFSGLPGRGDNPSSIRTVASSAAAETEGSSPSGPSGQTPARPAVTAVELPFREGEKMRPPRVVTPDEPASRSALPPRARETADAPSVAPAQESRPEPRVIGAFADTYLLVELGDALIVIDQHAAHERILYERFRRDLERGTAMQPLLTPIILSISPRERDILLDNEALLQEAGYEISPFGMRDIQVTAVPHVLGQAELRPLFMELIEQLDQLKNAAIDRRRNEIITASCKRAVKGGDRLSDIEIRALLDDMLTTDAPPNCPHGRPILKVFRKYEIERMFHRV
ncbi:MAG: DNA mismatch repair endonuclease MutL [Clostridia bacterium]|nr:DNA mismatch repair endonuclease MutL [Clostridia bacterium]